MNGRSTLFGVVLALLLSSVPAQSQFVYDSSLCMTDSATAAGMFALAKSLAPNGMLDGVDSFTIVGSCDTATLTIYMQVGMFVIPIPVVVSKVGACTLHVFVQNTIDSLMDACALSPVVAHNGAAAAPTTASVFVLPGGSAGTVAIAYRVNASRASLRVSRLDGTLVRSFTGLSDRGTVLWDGRDAAGRLLAHGQYLCELRAGERRVAASRFVR